MMMKKVMAMTRGTHPPWFTLLMQAVKYGSSTVKESTRKMTTRIQWLFHTSSITGTIRNVVTSITITTAVPAQTTLYKNKCHVEDCKVLPEGSE